MDRPVLLEALNQRDNKGADASLRCTYGPKTTSAVGHYLEARIYLGGDGELPYLWVSWPRTVPSADDWPAVV